MPLANDSSPPSTDVSPASIRSSVVLPEPLRPDSVIRSRRSSRNEMPRRSGSPTMSLARSEAMTTAMRSGYGGYTLGPMRRALHTLLLTAFLFALTAPVALAHDGGEGLYGETNDKVVTNAGFIIIAAFPFMIFVLSMIMCGAGQAQGPPQEGRQGAHALARTRVAAGKQPVRYERSGAAALLTIDRPERRNAIDGATARRSTTGSAPSWTTTALAR